MPKHFRKENILVERIMEISLHDDDSLILSNLKTLLGTGIFVSENTRFEILSYASKRLSIPHVAPGFTWHGEGIKANVGQGKLYVMVSSNGVRMLYIFKK